MTALAKRRGASESAWKFKQFTLAAGFKAWQNGAAFLNLATGKVEPAATETGYLYIGIFTESVDATAADSLVNVDLIEEVKIRWYVNANAPDAIAATDVGNLAYFMDDQTVCITSSGRTVAGRIWAIDAVKGVAVEKLDPTPRVLNHPAATTPAAYTANDLAVTAFVQDAVYDVPATGAASTITLPATAPDGARVYFAADGTKNANTVQYRDATGPTALTTALTASKRHLVELVKRGGKWFANAYVSP